MAPPKGLLERPGMRAAIVCLILALSTFLVYANSFSGPFVFDDLASIVENPSIRHLWPVGALFSAPPGTTVGARPLLNITLALNYAVSGTDVWSYHLFNLVVHILAGLALFGVLRRTLLRVRSDNMALPLAATVTLLWLVHPLQTESVSYIIQRAESMAGLWYLLTLYCVIRSIEAESTQRWSVLAILACGAGMATKEVMVTAPIVALIYDRIFVSGGFMAALKRRRALYLGLFGTWLILGYLLVAKDRGPSVGLRTGISPVAYALSQSCSIVKYLALTAWPHPLVFDYNLSINNSLASIGWCVIVIACLIIGIALLLRRSPPLGFAGVAFFAFLAPSSSVLPIMDIQVEHRMYLALAPVITLAVLGLYAMIGRRAFPLCVIWALGLAWTTVVRNQDYQSNVALWQKTVDQRPESTRARFNYALVLVQAGQTEEALAQFQRLIDADPGYPRAQASLGDVLSMVGRLPEAVGHYQLALRSDPDSAAIHLALGHDLAVLNQFEEALAQIQMALAINPGHALAHNELGKVLLAMGRTPEAISQFQDAIRIDPSLVEAQSNLQIAQRARPDSIR